MDQVWMSLRAYARHRGVALSAVQKAIEARRVTAIREEGGRITGIERNQADEQWAANTDAIEAARNGKFLEQPAAAAAPGAPVEKPADPSPTGDQGNFLAARVKEAELRGELLELDKLERMEQLAPWVEIDAEFGEIFAQLKSAAFRIPDRKAQVLASETDPVRIHRLLTEEIRAVFDEFSRRLSETAAAGVAGNAAVAAESEAALP